MFRVGSFPTATSTMTSYGQVTQALNQVQKNGGPINSHRVVLRSLEIMRDTAPDYYSRFMSYVDTLLGLDQSGQYGNGRNGAGGNVPKAKASTDKNKSKGMKPQRGVVR